MNHKTILLVDDDADDQFIFMDALNEISNEIECITANNGLEALVHLRTFEPTPSLIFLDLNMPMMNGIECLKHIKIEEKFKKIPVVVFTTSDNPSDRKRTMEMGVNIFFTKTSNFKLLKSTISEILKMDFRTPS